MCSFHEAITQNLEFCTARRFVVKKVFCHSFYSSCSQEVHEEFNPPPPEDEYVSTTQGDYYRDFTPIKQSPTAVISFLLSLVFKRVVWTSIRTRRKKGKLLTDISLSSASRVQRSELTKGIFVSMRFVHHQKCPEGLSEDLPRRFVAPSLRLCTLILVHRCTTTSSINLLHFGRSIEIESR